ncbi:glutamate--tRNA ligase family protein [Streptomyces lasiicapitis]|uniref:glutamate--tRNA ligase family protein n=1 Tax=Streptomyces lasiicapitis TaxID=1923961 RepID=UPI00188C32D1
MRFAPAPTSAIEINAARVALSNWAFALRNQGRFILRIADAVADRDRRWSDPRQVEEVIRVLAAFGIRGDAPAFQGPFFQSCNGGTPPSLGAAARRAACLLLRMCPVQPVVQGKLPEAEIAPPSGGTPRFMVPDRGRRRPPTTSPSCPRTARSCPCSPTLSTTSPRA